MSHRKNPEVSSIVKNERLNFTNSPYYKTVETDYFQVRKVDRCVSVMENLTDKIGSDRGLSAWGLSGDYEFT